MDESGPAGAARGYAGIESADSGADMGGRCARKADGYLLSFYFWLCNLFHGEGDSGAKLGKPLYAGRLFRIWRRAVYQSFLF